MKVILSPERRASLTAKAKTFSANLDEALPYLLSRCISREAAEMFGLGCVPEGQEHAGRLAIPYHTPAGVVQIKLRCIREDHQEDGKHAAKGCGKYMPIEAGLSLHLFNAQALIRSDDMVVVTEGELDAVCIQAYAGIPSVAYPGADTFRSQEHFRLCFEGQSSVVVLADGDKVGREAARSVAESIGYSARVVELPEGSDANSYLMEKGVQSLLNRLNA